MSEFFNEGMRHYFDALIAMRDFCSEAISTSRTVLIRRREALGNAVGSFDSSSSPMNVDINPDLNPDCQPNWPGTWHWLCVRMAVGNVGYFYFGLLWERDSDEIRPSAVGTFRFGDATIFDLAQNRFNALKSDLKPDPHEKEITIRKEIAAGEEPTFGSKLEQIADEWTRLWERIGGMEGLTRAKQGGA